MPLRALANALLSAENTTDLSRLQQVNVSLSPGQAGAPEFPAILPAPVPQVTLVNLTTMQRDLQNAYSRQASLEVERQVGRLGTLSVGYSYLRGLGLLMAINQNVPSCAPAGTNNGCRPIPDYANNSQYSSAGESVYHGLLVSFAQRPSAWGYYRVSYTLSKSENNVGEFFFSGPVDPYDLSKDWGRSDNDRRHLFVFSGGVNTSMAPATTAWEALSHGFQLSGTGAGLLRGALQHHVRRHHRPGNRGPAGRRRRVHPAQRRRGRCVRQRRHPAQPIVPAARRDAAGGSWPRRST